MYSLRAALAALDVDGLLGALGAPLLARAPERLLRPDEEEDDRLRRATVSVAAMAWGGRRRRVRAARIARSTAAESQYFSSGFDAFLLMTSHWFEPFGTWGQSPMKYKTARPWTWAMWPPARTRLAPHAIAATVRGEFQAPTLHP